MAREGENGWFNNILDDEKLASGKLDRGNNSNNSLFTLKKDTNIFFYREIKYK